MPSGRGTVPSDVKFAKKKKRCEQDSVSWARRARSAESGLCPRKSRRRRRDDARAKTPSPRSAKKNTPALPLLFFRTPAACVAPPTPPPRRPSRNPARRRRRGKPRRLSRSASGARRTREFPARVEKARSRTTLSFRRKTKEEKGNERLFAPRLKNLLNRSRDRRTASRASNGAARRGRARRARPSSSRAPRRSRRTEAATRKTTTRKPVTRAGANAFLRKSFLASSWRTSSASTTPSRSNGTARATAPGAGWRIS